MAGATGPEDVCLVCGGDLHIVPAEAPERPSGQAPARGQGPDAEPVRVPPPRPEWVIAAAVGATIAILLGAVVAWRLSDDSLLPTVESLGGPDNVDSAVPLPPPPPEPTASDDEEQLPIEVPAEIEAEEEGSAQPAGSGALSASATASSSGPRR